MQNIVAPIRLWLIQIWFEVLKLINIPAFAKATWDSKVATYLCGEGSALGVMIYSIRSTSKQVVLATMTKQK
jgi:hypothetical protein